MTKTPPKTPQKLLPAKTLQALEQKILDLLCSMDDAGLENFSSNYDAATAIVREWSNEKI